MRERTLTSSSIGEELWKLKDKVDQYWEAEFLRRANFLMKS